MEENNKPLQPQTTSTSQKQEVKAPKISVILMLVFVLGLQPLLYGAFIKPPSRLLLLFRDKWNPAQ